MIGNRTTQETLAGRVLAEHEKHSTAAAASPHPEDDTLALFAEGRIQEPQLGRVIQHLADCGDCRSKTGLLLIAADEDTEPTRLLHTTAWYRRPTMQILALAAGLLLCVTGFFLFQEQRDRFAENSAYRSAEQSLADGNYDEAKATVDRARNENVTSARLDNLAAQALRRISSTVALASAGKLTELGIGIGGIVAREPSARTSATDAKRAMELLDAAAPSDLHAALNRGHLLLQLNEPAQALDQFRSVVVEHPDEPLAWLGLGIAQYMANDYSSAVDSFHQCVTLEPNNLPARMNLAMSYDELGDVAKSRSAWKDLLSGSSAKLSADERNQIEAQIRVLE